MKRILLFALLLSVVLIACKPTSDDPNNGDAKVDKNEKVTIIAAGATFPQPYYNVVFKTYTKAGNPLVTYGGIGSGGGIRSLKDQIVDIAASDAYLSDNDIKELPGKALHIPTCMGAVVLAYKLEGVAKLKLDGKTIADIFLGNITKWNDKAIKALNPGVKLPNLDVTTVYRSDGSGTTFIFSDYLSKVSQQWKSEIGRGKALQWKTGASAKGNPGVAGTIAVTNGAIGYIGSEFAFSAGIPFAILKNKAGNFVKPSPETISAAANGELPADNRVMMTDQAADDAYPISAFTWLLIYQEQSYNGRSLKQAQETVKFLKWMLSDEAQENTLKVHYAPLPQKAIDNSMKLLKTVKYNGKPIS